MIITRKRFEHIVAMRVNAAKKAERLKERIRQQEVEIKKLRGKVYILSDRVEHLEEKAEKKGSINGFYIGSGGTVPCSVTIEKAEGSSSES